MILNQIKPSRLLYQKMLFGNSNPFDNYRNIKENKRKFDLIIEHDSKDNKKMSHFLFLE